MNLISQRLKALRMRAGLSQEELAERLGFTRGAVNAYEHGTTPPMEKLQAFCSFFNVTMEAMTQPSDDDNNIGEPGPPRYGRDRLEEEIRYLRELVNKLLERIPPGA